MPPLIRRTASFFSLDVERYPAAIPRPLVVRVAPLRPHREVQPAHFSERKVLFKNTYFFQDRTIFPVQGSTIQKKIVLL